MSENSSGNERHLSELYLYRAEILRVIDGDTVDVSIDLGFHVWTKQRLRLMGINAPEKRGQDKASGLAARLHLKSLIEHWEPIIVATYKDEQGKYGRYLAELLGHDGRSLNAQMVKDGYATRIE